MIKSNDASGPGNPEVPLLFIKAAKVLAFSIAFLPLLGCAIGTGILFAALVKATAYAPETEDSLFNYSMLGFAFIESFAFMLFGIAGLIYSF
jgi:F0F1-type ATP synthase membrane subunit c/vacuolar-type H+-ATPase subunit K